MFRLDQSRFTLSFSQIIGNPKTSLDYSFTLGKIYQHTKVKFPSLKNTLSILKLSTGKTKPRLRTLFSNAEYIAQALTLSKVANASLLWFSSVATN